jgi:hypothetical protein
MSKSSFLYSLIGVLLAIGLSSCSPFALQVPEIQAEPDIDNPAVAQAEPNPELSPEEVVKIQVEALQNNDDLDRGIEITFRFASPANKQLTGPLYRFKQLVKDPAYRPMLNHKLAEYGPMEISGDVATQRVTIVERNGQATVYLFSLSRQNGPGCEGCWMTDSVIVVPTRKQDLQGI